MSIEFDKLSNEELEKLKTDAEANLRLMSAARSLKSRSTAILAGFQAAIAQLAQMKVLVERGFESSSYDRHTKNECRVFTLKGDGKLHDAFALILRESFYGTDMKRPFGLVPVKEFWEEWTTTVLKMTIRMVNKYQKQYVEPYPTEPAEAIKAFKIGDAIEEAAQNGPLVEENDIPF